MANDEEYEIMPHKTISKIKKEIETLKEKSKSQGEVASPGFKKSMDELTKSMNSLMKLFKEAGEEMKIEERTEENIEEKLGPLIKKVNKIEEENERIAEGILTVADMVKDLKTKVEKRPPQPRPMPHFRPIPEPIKFKAPRRPMPPSMGKPIPPPKMVMQQPQRRPPMPPPFEVPPREFPKTRPFPPPAPRPPMEEGFPPGMPMPPPPPEFEEKPKKKKGLFGLFRK